MKNTSEPLPETLGLGADGIDPYIEKEMTENVNQGGTAKSPFVPYSGWKAFIMRKKFAREKEQ